MNIIHNLQQSLSAKLSFWVVLSVAALFLASLGIMFHYSRQAVKEEAMEKATQTLESTVLHIDNTLHKVEVAADNMKWLVEKHISTPDSMFTFSRKILENNPDFNGCSIAFEPYYYPSKGRVFSAYSYNGRDSIETEQEGNALYEYYCMDWYLIPKLLDKPYWVEPFREYDTGGIQVADVITSYCQPIHDHDNRVVGILSVDLSLNWFSQTILNAKPFPNSYCMLVGNGGTFLVHPDSTKLFYQTIFTPTLEEPDTMRTALGEAMIAGESGYKVFHLNGEDNYVFYKPFKELGWSVAIVCPEQDIFEPYNQLQKVLMIITVVGLLLLLFFCLYIIRESLRPLRHLARSAQQIAEGNFDDPIPDSRQQDEIGYLQHSFFKMQKSLASYISKLHHSTSTLTERNKELLHANELAKEADRVKTAFIYNMTDRMEQPVSAIAREAETIWKGHQHFTEAEMKQHVDQMLTNTDLITQLLNQLLEASESGKPSDVADTDAPAIDTADAGTSAADVADSDPAPDSDLEAPSSIPETPEQ